MAEIHIGTSSWRYGHWRGPFYPAELKPTDFLAHYAAAFRTVEVNNTFCRLPDRRILARWRAATPPAFVFACKANRFITHMKKLGDPERSLPPFFDALDALAPKLGPILFQLPPRWRVDLSRLEAFLDALPGGYRYAFDFRDRSWFGAGTDAALAKRNAALCIYDLGGVRAPMRITTDFVYVRLHGPGVAYRGRYDGRALASWAHRLRGWRARARDVYCYFDNDEQAFAPRDARRLLDMIARRDDAGAAASA